MTEPAMPLPEAQRLTFITQEMAKFKGDLARRNEADKILVQQRRSSKEALRKNAMRIEDEKFIFSCLYFKVFNFCFPPSVEGQCSQSAPDENEHEDRFHLKAFVMELFISRKLLF